MKLRVATGVLVLVLGVAGCASAPDMLVASELEGLFIKDFTSSEPAACTTADVDLSNSEARQFFLRARQISYRQLQDDYPLAPCRVEGVLTYRGQACDWNIGAAGTGSIVCGARRWYFACDDCADLLLR